MARLFRQHQQVFVTGLKADEHELTTVIASHLRHRRANVAGTIIGGVADTYVVRHDFDHSVAAYSGAELAEFAAPKAVDEPERTEGGMTFATA